MLRYNLQTDFFSAFHRNLNCHFCTVGGILKFQTASMLYAQQTADSKADSHMPSLTWGQKEPFFSAKHLLRKTFPVIGDSNGQIISFQRKIKSYLLPGIAQGIYRNVLQHPVQQDSVRT